MPGRGTISATQSASRLERHVKASLQKKSGRYQRQKQNRAELRSAGQPVRRSPHEPSTSALPQETWPALEPAAGHFTFRLLHPYRPLPLCSSFGGLLGLCCGGGLEWCSCAGWDVLLPPVFRGGFDVGGAVLPFGGWYVELFQRCHVGCTSGSFRCCRVPDTSDWSMLPCSASWSNSAG